MNRFRVTLLSLANVGVSFGATELFKNVTFTVADGERWGIIGRNGASRCGIERTLKPTAGCSRTRALTSSVRTRSLHRLNFGGGCM